MPEFSIYSLVLFTHVVSALILFATSMFAPLILGQIRSARTMSELQTWVEFERRSTKWNPAAAFVLLGTGVYLGSLGFWTMGWFWVAAAMWVVCTLLAVGVVGRSLAALHVATKSPEDAPIPQALDAVRWSRPWTIAQGALLGSDLAMFFVMFNKPDLAPSIAIAAIAMLITVAVGLARRRTHPKTWSTSVR